MRFRFAVLQAFVGLMIVACSGDSDERPVRLSLCIAATCPDDRPCDPEDGVCRCTADSCGDGLWCDPDLGICGEPPCDDEACGEGMHCDPVTDECVEAPCTQGSCEEGLKCDTSSGICELDLEDRCREGVVWRPGMQAFRNATATAAFEELGVQGVRISVTDIDGDGFPDLVVRRTGASEDDFGPEGARAVWLLRNRGDATFEDVTQSSGLVSRRSDNDTSRGRAAEIITWADVNNNGHLDAVTLFTNPADALSPEGAEVMLNDGTGRFSLGPVSQGLHLGGQQTSRGGAAFTDVNRDGVVDLWVGQGSQDQLFLGDGQGGFTEVTHTAGLQTQPWLRIDVINEARAHTNSWSVAACDLDGNGTPNLLSASYGRAPNHLWLGSRSAAGDVTYTNHSVASGYAFDHRMDWSDHEGARCHCKINPTAPDCAGVPAPQFIRCDSAQDIFRWNHDNDREPFRLGGNSGTTVCADINNNGRLDLLTTEIRHWDVGSSSDPSEILYNTGQDPVQFERPGNNVTGLHRQHNTVAWDDGDITAAVFDFDNDGRLDILIASTDYPGTRAHLFHQQVDGTFIPVPIDLGIDLTSAHGIAVADFDGDGDLDLVIGHSRSRCGSGDHCLEGAHPRYFENLIGQSGNWFQIKLEGGEGTNRAAIGARITIEADGLIQTREIGGGHGHYGIQHDLVAHFGLGQACAAQVTIRWPDDALTTQELRLSSGYRYHIVQGADPVVLR